MEENQGTCTICGIESSSRCAGCKQVYYCGHEHQKLHWKIHKNECANMKKQREEEETGFWGLECAFCGITEPSAHIMLCAKCQMVGYCGKEHQLAHWKSFHAENCSMAKGTRVLISAFCSTYMVNPVLYADYPQFRTDKRFQKLAEGVNKGGKRRWLRNARDMLLHLAEVNDEKGQLNIATFYHFGYGVKQDFKKAAKWYSKAVDRGNLMAMSNLAELYSTGQGVPKDINKAMSLMQQSADQGCVEAQLNLGMVFNGSIDGMKNLKTAAKWFQKAADQGHPEAQLRLGAFYIEGEGVEQDGPKGEKYIRLAAAQGHPIALELLEFANNEIKK